MPLAEEHVAAFVVALQNLDIALSSRILILVNSELSRFGDVFIDFDRAEVKLFSAFDSYFSTVRYLITNLLVRDIVLKNFRLELYLIHEAHLPMATKSWIINLFFISLGSNFFLNVVVDTLPLVRQRLRRLSHIHLLLFQLR